MLQVIMKLRLCLNTVDKATDKIETVDGEAKLNL